jgi:uncharacterized protein (TIGR03435 family)
MQHSHVGTAVAGDAPPLVTALREQLGLRLESGSAPLDVFVIDRPTSNEYRPPVDKSRA